MQRNIGLFDCESRINRNLKRGCQRIRFAGHADYSKKFGILLVREPFGPSRRGMRMHAIAAAVHGGDRDINQFFGKWIERARLDHDLFNA